MSITILIVSLQIGMSQSQSIERSVIASYGDFSSNATISISSTVGETIVATQSSATIIINQGFQQANISTVGIAHNLLDNLDIILFPNPTQSVLIIQTSAGSVAGKLEYTLFDLSGKLHRSGMFINIRSGVEHSIDVEQLAAGEYLLTLSNHKNQRSKVFQIIKL